MWESGCTKQTSGYHDCLVNPIWPVTWQSAKFSNMVILHIQRQYPGSPSRHAANISGIHSWQFSVSDLRLHLPPMTMMWALNRASWERALRGSWAGTRRRGRMAPRSCSAWWPTTRWRPTLRCSGRLHLRVAATAGACFEKAPLEQPNSLCMRAAGRPGRHGCGSLSIIRTTGASKCTP